MDEFWLLRLFILCVVFVFYSHVAYAWIVLKSSAKLSLDGQWNVANKNESIVIKAQVPGSIYTDLLRAGIIEDPYYRNNDVLYRWIGQENWMFYRTFNVECDILQKDRIILVFHGLDTVSEISLNGELIGTPQNMFVRNIFDVKHLLQASNNSINVSFQSAVKYAETQHTKQIIDYVIPPTCPPPVQHGECHVNYIRKIQSSFSWDWGPSFPTQGIWKNVELIGFNSIIIRDVTVFPEKLTDSNELQRWQLKVTIYVETAGTDSIQDLLTVYLAGILLLNRTVVFNPNQSQTAEASFVIRIPQKLPIKLWWPNGLGEQNMYDLDIEFFSHEEYSRKKVKIGFRTVELVQEPIQNSSGLSFYFRVNGIPFFAKGSNWIPADSFPERITSEYTRYLLQSAKDAHMNMIRVWGGGAYETEEFYNIADEMGIFIWQDIMFAVALYPVQQDFLNLVALEVQQQVRRLQHHPCLLLWAGNNENEQGLVGRWWPVVSQRFEQYKSDYIKLYIETIMPIVKTEDPSRPFLSSSPSNGLETEKEGWLASDPQSTHYGDVHFYTYIDEEWDWKTYPRARFVSEYGFQSYPSFESFANVSNPEDWTFPYSDFLEHRQHHMFGNLQISAMITKHMSLPSQSCGAQGFKDLLYLSQIVQAVSIKTETEKYRRSMSEIIDGEGKTMGALYWQLNDIWQGPSWSSIEYGGKWKMLHYFAQNFFAPLLISPYVDNGMAILYVISDFTTAFVNMTVNITVHKWSSFQPKYSESFTFNQPPLLAQRVYSRNITGENGLLEKGQCSSERECFIYFTLNSVDSKIKSQNFLLLSEFNNAEGLQKSEIKIINVSGPIQTKECETTFKIVLHANHISVFVWLEALNIRGRFTDNGFIMIEDTKTVLFYSVNNITVEAFTSSLTVRSLTDVCH